ncbi:MAG: DsbA family protein [Candidatus Nomurabacteria bacterium]|jgi:protein-disulfide isomerase|nr:DsbA family protein [Candidatus Nomurabacteria bacterium]
MNKGTIIAIVLVLLGFVGILMFAQNGKKEDENMSYDINRPIEAGDDNGGIADHVRGNKDAKLIIVEYGDLQCAGCASAEPVMKEIADYYGDKIGLVFRNYPITSGHPHSKAAAAAIEAAGKQGAYFEMLDLMYANQAVWSGSATVDNRYDMFLDIFKSIDIITPDEDKFKSDYASSDINKKIDFDLKMAAKQEVTYTPFFLINGEQIVASEWSVSGRYDVSKIKAYIDKKLEELGEIEKPQVVETPEAEESGN